MTYDGIGRSLTTTTVPEYFASILALIDREY